MSQSPFHFIPFDIIIQAGQSNAEGCGYGSASQPYVPTPDILYMTRDFKIASAAERVWEGRTYSDFSLSFVREYVRNGRLVAGRRVLVLRSAVGGTGFLTRRWGPSDDLYLTMVGMTAASLAMNAQNRVVALLWHQGETDADYGAGYDTHFNNLTGLIDSIRNTAKNPSLPFIAGDFVQDWKGKHTAICEPVIAAIRGAVASAGAGAFVESDELPSNAQVNGDGDDIHFSREGLYTLGRRYFEAWRGIALPQA